ncbi:MAG: hypothetical protein WCH43_16320, partial [Verrucomicrobiota bacterium]
MKRSSTMLSLVCVMFMVSHAESGAGTQTKIEQMQERFARADAEALSRLPCADRFQVVFIRSCQSAVLSDESFRFMGEYSQTYCAGAAHAFVRAEQIGEAAVGGGECPMPEARNLGTETGQALIAKLKT